MTAASQLAMPLGHVPLRYLPLFQASNGDLRQLLVDACDNCYPVTLRPYQVEARDNIIAEWDKGKLSTLAAMATGTGKTHLFLGTLHEEWARGNVTRALILVNFQHLVYQPVERVVQNWPDLPCPGVVMGELEMPDESFVVATVQTLTASGGHRLERLLRAGSFSHLIIDEAHFAVSSTYFQVIRRLRAANPNLRILGVTATPKRTDGAGLSKVFQSVAHRISIKDAIRLGALVPFMALAVELPLSIADVPENGEGWDDEALGDVMSARNALEIIVETWKKHAEERQTIAFTASVKQAHRLAEAFNEAGIPAAAIDGTTPKSQRWELVRRYKAGELKLLSNCYVLTMGFDAPETGCILNVKPTKSDLVYVQMAGRGLRLAPGKDTALILDFCPRDARDMVLAGDLLGKPREQKKREQKARQEGVVLDVFGIDAEGHGIDGDPDQVVLRVLDFLSTRPNMRKLAWLFDGTVASVSVGKSQALALVTPQRDRIEAAKALRASEQWNPLWEVEYQRLTQYHLFHILDNKQLRLLASTNDEEEAYDRAEKWAEANAAAWAASRSRRWRDRPPTDGRRRFAMRLGVYDPAMTDGEASQAICHELTLRALRRGGVIR